MPISDSPYTNPDSLRLLYLNPKNVLRALNEVLGDDEQQQFASLPMGVPITSGGNIGGGGIIDDPTGCPAVGQYTISLMPGTKSAKYPRLVEELVPGRDSLWQPITKAFRKLVGVRIIPNVECAIYRTFDGAESIVSLTDQIIQAMDDNRGRQLMDLIAEPDASHANVTSIEFQVGISAIEWIRSFGRRDVVQLTLEGDNGDIYASGSNPLFLTVRHNNKVGPGGGGGGGLEPPEV